MEAIFGLILIFVVIAVVRAVVGTAANAGVRTAKAVGRTVSGQGGFGENLSEEFNGPSEFKTRLVRGTLEGPSGDGNLDCFYIEARGMLPVVAPTELAFVTTLVDSTSEEDKGPVLSMVDSFQEDETTAFHLRAEGGHASFGTYFKSWARIGGIIPEILIPPRGGSRKITAITWVVNDRMSPPFMLGYCPPEHPAVLGAATAEFNYTFELQGYEEQASNQEEARVRAVELAVAMAMADGEWHDSENAAIQSWIAKVCGGTGPGSNEELGKRLRSALRSSLASAKNGDLTLSAATEWLAENANTPHKFEAADLCLEVMAADGVAEEAELGLVRRVADALELDFGQLQTVMDSKLVGLSAGSIDTASPQAVLGIHPDWGREQVLEHLRAEYSKWNARMNTLDEGSERENAQRMLELIAETRKKYAS